MDYISACQSKLSWVPTFREGGPKSSIKNPDFKEAIMFDRFPKWIQVFPYPTQTSGETALRETTVCSTRMSGTTIYDSKSIFISFDMRKFVVKILTVQYSGAGCKDSTDP